MNPIASILGRPVVRWALGTLLLAPAAIYAYAFFEWLFLTTTASPVAALSRDARLEALVKGPVPFLLPVALAQSVASVLSTFHRKLRFLAVVPAAAILGLLLFVLIDNFTYTIVGFGVLKSGAVLRLGYVALLAILVGVAGHKLFAWIQPDRQWPAAISTAGALVVCTIVGAHAFTAKPTPLEPSVGATEPGSAPVSPATRDDSSDPSPSERRPNVLFLGTDGLDAPYLSVYGYERKTTPYLERLAPEALVFENAFSNVGRTHGSLVSLLTGRLPTRTKVTFPPTILQGDDSVRHLPALLKERGYATLQIGMRHYADAEDANLRKGFDAANYRWEDLMSAPAATADDDARLFRVAMIERAEQRILHALGSREVVDVFAHVEGKREDPYWSDERRVSTLVSYFREAPEPWFVHVHLLDSHCCNERPNNRTFGTGERSRRDTRDNAILESDGHIESLVEALRRNGQLDRTIVVISSDHTSSWETTGRVPLIVRFPGAEPRGKVAVNVQLADVAPTVLDDLGIEVPPWMDGISLLSSPPIDRPIFGICDVVGRKAVAHRLSEVSNAEPPNYGSASASIILGARWYELSLIDGSLSSGRIRGHTAVGARDVPDEVARALLVAHLESNGFRIGRAEGERSKETATRTATAAGR